MAELLLAWFSIYGLPLVVVATIIGQMGVPTPVSILLLTVGAMMSDSVYSPIAVFAMCLLAAHTGGQIGYWLGRFFGPTIINWLHGSRYHELIERAEAYSKRYGPASIFITRWLVSPVSPYLNYIIGMAQVGWSKFTIMSISGEAIWVAMYLTLGHVFSQSIATTDDLLANSMWFVGALIAAVMLGKPFAKTWRRISAKRAERRADR